MVTLGRDGELCVLKGGAVASHIDGVHDSERAAYSEEKAEKEADRGCPVKGHDVQSIVAVYIVFDGEGVYRPSLLKEVKENKKK